MKRFLRQYSEKITGVISCFDRVLFKGCLPLGWSEAMENFLAAQGLRIKDFGNFVQRQSGRIADHAEGLAKRSGRQYVYLNGPHRKEDIAKTSPNGSPKPKASPRAWSVCCGLSNLASVSK